MPGKRSSIRANALVAALIALSALCLSPAASAEGPGAYFAVASQTDNESFVIMLTDPARIREARAIISGMQADRTHVSGRIIKERADYNGPWGFHLAPDSITFFQNNNESCDAAIKDVEGRLGEAGGAFLPGNKWCPWDSKVIKEIIMGPDGK
ncbi:MAG TPA: hypothetical protein VII64_13770 [Thermodesulfobacteriota bacterium]